MESNDFDIITDFEGLIIKITIPKTKTYNFSTLQEKLNHIAKILDAKTVYHSITENFLYIFIKNKQINTNKLYATQKDFFELGNKQTSISFYNKEIYKNLFLEIYKISTAIDYLISENIN